MGIHRVSVFTSDGHLITTFGRKGKELGEFDDPRERLMLMESCTSMTMVTVVSKHSTQRNWHINFYYYHTTCIIYSYYLQQHCLTKVLKQYHTFV